MRELRFSRARSFLPERLQTRVVGATWHSEMRFSEDLRPLGRTTWWDQASRYEQIKRYVDRAGLSTWLAIDDQPDEWSQEDLHHLLRTDSMKGLSDPGVRSLLENWLAATQPCVRPPSA